MSRLVFIYRHYRLISVLQVAELIFQYLSAKDLESLCEVKEFRKPVEAWRDRNIPVEVVLGNSEIATNSFRTLVFPRNLDPATLASEITKANIKCNIKLEQYFRFTPDLIEVLHPHHLSIKSLELYSITLLSVTSPLGFSSMQKLTVIEDNEVFGLHNEFQNVLGDCQPEEVTVPDDLLPALTGCTRIKHLTITSVVVILLPIIQSLILS